MGEKKEGCCSPTPKWLCTFEGILKIVEFVVCLLCWIICVAGYGAIDDPHISGRFIYFLIIGALCLIFTLLVILLYLCGCFRRRIEPYLEKLYAWYIFLLSYSLIWFFFWLCASALLLSYYSYWLGLVAAAFFGVICTILFFIDSVTYYRICRRHRPKIRQQHRNLLESQAQEQQV